MTDRPDFTESPRTVGRGVVQLESGYTYTYDDYLEFSQSWTVRFSLTERVGSYAELYVLAP